MGGEQGAASVDKIRDILFGSQITAILPRFLSNVRRNPSAISAALARGDFDSVRSLGH